MIKFTLHILILVSFLTFISNYSLRILEEQSEPAIVIDTVINNGAETIPVIIGTPSANQSSQTFNFDFGLTEYSYVSGINCTECPTNRFNPSLSNTATNTNNNASINVHLGMNGLVVNGTFYTDVINLTSASSTNNFFLVADVNNLGNQGMLGFPLAYSDPKYKNSSIFDQIMKQNREDYHRIITHKTISNTQGKFYLGAYPNELTNGNFPFTKCSAESDWSCRLSYINFGKYEKLKDGLKVGNQTTNYDNSYFSFSFEEIIAPKYILDQFNNSFFNKAIDGNNCSLIDILPGLSKISCSQQYYNSTNFTDIHFAFDQAAYRINGSSGLFKQDEVSGNYTFAIHFFNATNSWTFGTSFLRNFITVFDGESGKIGFFGPDVTDFSSSTGVLLIVIIVGALIVVLGVLFLVCLFRKQEDQDTYSSQK